VGRTLLSAAFDLDFDDDFAFDVGFDFDVDSDFAFALDLVQS
jgi:hypothetical protein